MRAIQPKLSRSTALAAGFVLLLNLASVVTTAQRAVAPPAIQNFGKVNDNYYRGSQPNKSQLVSLKAMGVKTIIDLRKDHLPDARQWAVDAGLNYFNIPLLSGRRATKEQTEYFLRLVNDPANA